MVEHPKSVNQTRVHDQHNIYNYPVWTKFSFRKSSFKKLTICMTYPSDYPAHHILIELKSKTIGQKLLDGLVKVSEEEAKKFEGKPHCLRIIK